MAAVMQRAIQADDDAVAQEQAVIEQLKIENKTLRELLHVTVHSSRLCLNEQTDIETQTEGAEGSTGDQNPEGGAKKNTSVTNTPTSGNKNAKDAKDIQNDANKNSPKKSTSSPSKDDDSSNTGTIKKNDKKKAQSKK